MSHLSQSDDSVLIVIDIQTSFAGTMPAKVMTRLLRYTGLLIRAAHLMDIPILLTEQYPAGLGHTEPELLDVLPDDVKKYEKTCFSSVRAEGFLDELKSLNRKQVILTGMEAHVCVLQTAIDLINENYQVMTVADAISSRYRDNYEIALSRMAQAGVIITNAESVVFEWMEDAKHPQFKEIQSHLK